MNIWIVTCVGGIDLACETRDMAMEHAGIMAADFPDAAPWNVAEYAPAADLAAARAKATETFDAFMLLSDKHSEMTRLLEAANNRIAQRDAQIAVYNSGGFADADALAEKFLAQSADLAAAQTDAERYRWLRNEDNWSEEGPMPCVATFDSTIYGAALDAAIDAALKEKS